MFCGVIEELVEQWGFKGHLGRMWALLYLSETPMNQTQIEETLGLSKGNVNGLLHELLRWGVVQKTRIPGDRHHYYRVDDEIWRSITNVIQARELRILDDAIEKMEHIETSFQENPSTDALEYQKTRTKYIFDALKTSQSLTRILVGTSSKQMTRLAKMITKLQNF